MKNAPFRVTISGNDKGLSPPLRKEITPGWAALVEAIYEQAARLGYLTDDAPPAPPVLSSDIREVQA